jgi:hypothetical protein
MVMVSTASEQGKRIDPDERPNKCFVTSDPWRVVYFRQHLGSEVLVDDSGLWIVKSVEHREPGVAEVTLSLSLSLSADPSGFAGPTN